MYAQGAERRRTIRYMSEQLEAAIQLLAISTTFSNKTSLSSLVVIISIARRFGFLAL
jgi:hypothetical protein